MLTDGRNGTPKILLVAEHASSTFGGEALIPFQFFKQLREMGVDVHLLVHARTRDELAEAFASDLDRLHFVKDSLINIWCNKIGRFLPDRIAVFTLGSLSHLDTQIRQRRMARRLVRDQGFDIIHEPIPVSPKLPSLLFGMSVPVVIGPMNGGMDYPPNYNLAGFMERLIVPALRLTAGVWNMLLPGKEQAALLLVANKRTFEALPPRLKKKNVQELVENGVDMDLFAPHRHDANSGPLRIIYVGRMIELKRIDLLLDACARLVDKVDFHLDLVGDGPVRGALEAQVVRLNLGDRTKFHGRVSQPMAAEMLRNADVMVLPSMHECGGAVVLEAMACGLPVIATHWGGPADYVTPETGILIPPATPEQYVAELSNFLMWAANNPESRAKMGAAGRHRAATLYDWRVKARDLLQIYRNILRGGGTYQLRQT